MILLASSNRTLVCLLEKQLSIYFGHFFFWICFFTQALSQELMVSKPEGSTSCDRTHAHVFIFCHTRTLHSDLSWMFLPEGEHSAAPTWIVVHVGTGRINSTFWPHRHSVDHPPYLPHCDFVYLLKMKLKDQGSDTLEIQYTQMCKETRGEQEEGFWLL